MGLIFNDKYNKHINIELLERLWRKKGCPGKFKTKSGIVIKNVKFDTGWSIDIVEQNFFSGSMKGKLINFVPSDTSICYIKQ